MVRVISEKLFSPPRSRHSSGETVDKELAARAVEALSSLNSRRLDLSDYESSSDSHWDSELDLDGDCAESASGDQFAEGVCRARGTEVVRKRKERRRERNKKSAQAYRIRRKEQTCNQQKVLSTLHEENSRLKKMVHSLESELEEVRHAVRHRLPATALAPAPSATLFSPLPAPTPTASTTTTTSFFSPSPPAAVKPQPASVPSFSFSVGQTFSQLAQQEAKTEPAVDNHHSRRMLISPVIDNFSFSRSTPAPSSPVPVPMTTATNPPATSFTFPSRALHPASPFSKPNSPLPTISEKPVVHCGRFVHHPQQQQQQQHSDLNANAANGNTLNANSNTAFGMCKNNNTNMNNNNNNLNNHVFVGESMGVGAGLLAPKASFQFSNKV